MFLCRHTVNSVSVTHFHHEKLTNGCYLPEHTHAHTQTIPCFGPLAEGKIYNVYLCVTVCVCVCSGLVACEQAALRANPLYILSTHPLTVFSPSICRKLAVLQPDPQQRVQSMTRFCSAQCFFCRSESNKTSSLCSHSALDK